MSTQLALSTELPLHGPKRRRYALLDDFRGVLDFELRQLRRLPGIKRTDSYNDGWRFRNAFQVAYPEWDYLDVLTERGEPVSLAGELPYLRPMRDLARSIKPNAKAGEHFWSRLGDEWLQMYDVINAETHTEAKVWLWKQRKPVEMCQAVYSFAFWVALSYLRGEALRGGAHHIEFRRKR